MWMHAASLIICCCAYNLLETASFAAECALFLVVGSLIQEGRVVCFHHLGQSSQLSVGHADRQFRTWQACVQQVH